MFLKYVLKLEGNTPAKGLILQVRKVMNKYLYRAETNN